MTIAVTYGKAAQGLLNGVFDLTNDTIKCCLLDSNYVPDIDADEFLADIDADEVTGTGYTTGGATLANKAVAYVGASNKATFDADNPSWATATISGIRYAVFYRWSGSAATSALLCYMDFETDQSCSGETWGISIPAGGILEVAV